MIKLDKQYLIASGTNRACYIHPTDEQKCIKITISGNHKETNREANYYKYLQKKDVSWDMLAKFYGFVETDIGKGEVVELIRNYDLDISKSLDHYFRKIKSQQDINFFLNLLVKLKKYLYKEKIYIKDLNAVNIVYQKYNQTDGRLVIIDGLAHSNYIPFARSIDSITTKKIDKSWNHFMYKIKKRCATKYNPDIKSALQKSELEL